MGYLWSYKISLLIWYTIRQLSYLLLVNYLEDDVRWLPMYISITYLLIWLIYLYSKYSHRRRNIPFKYISPWFFSFELTKWLKLKSFLLFIILFIPFYSYKILISITLVPKNFKIQELKVVFFFFSFRFSEYLDDKPLICINFKTLYKENTISVKNFLCKTKRVKHNVSNIKRVR